MIEGRKTRGYEIEKQSTESYDAQNSNVPVSGAGG
jgi:hypothetical protein